MGLSRRSPLNSSDLPILYNTMMLAIYILRGMLDSKGVILRAEHVFPGIGFKRLENHKYQSFRRSLKETLSRSE